MGRAFEFRKERKFKEITIAAKAGGPDPDSNPRLRTLIQTAKSENMPKDNIERAIKRAVEKDQGNYEEIVYEGFGPHGIAFLIETATDNNMRTVANIRSYFTKVGGSLGTQGCVSFMFDHKCVFKVRKDSPVDLDELELELIDYGVDDVYRDEEEDLIYIYRDEEEDLIYIYGEFESFGNIQKYLEDNGFTIVSGGFERIPNVPLKKLSPDEKEGILKLIDKLENDDDVQNVYHTMEMADEE